VFSVFYLTVTREGKASQWRRDEERITG